LAPAIYILFILKEFSGNAAHFEEPKSTLQTEQQLEEGWRSIP